MENCVVCLKSNEDILSRITTTSEEWVKNKMQKIIEKHLWWWYLRTIPKENTYIPWICRQCWREISGFHDFYMKVEKAHRHYQPFSVLCNKVKNEQEIPPASPETEAKVENMIDIEEIKAEYFDSFFNESAVEKAEDMSIFDENALSTDMILRDVENSHCGRNKTNIWKNKAPEGIKLRGSTKRKSNVSRSRKLKITTQKIATKKENCKYQDDNFFQENQHSLECCICNVPLLDFRSIKAHYRNEHNTRGYALCCGKKYFKRCLLVDHLRVHKDPNFFKCDSCKKTFETRRGLEMHMDTHKARERKYSCDDCGKSYFKLNIYQRHKLIHVPDIEKKFKCSQCDKKFASDDLRRRHEDSTHARKNAKVCDICGKSFCYGYSFMRHMEEHAGIPQSMVSCDICGVKLTNKYGLRQHIKMRHMEENLKEQICPHCSRVSPNVNAHRKHIKYSHTMLRNHACHLCEKAFRRPLELKEHLSTHTGEALYTCPHCPRTFISNANMHKHRKIAHRLEWEENRVNKLNKRGKTVTILPTTNNNKEVIQSGAENTTDPFATSFAKYLENIDN